jgi:hypothetical protein
MYFLEITLHGLCICVSLLTILSNCNILWNIYLHIRRKLLSQMNDRYFSRILDRRVSRIFFPTQSIDLLLSYSVTWPLNSFISEIKTDAMGRVLSVYVPLLQL